MIKIRSNPTDGSVKMADSIDKFFMNMALELAERGKGFTSPNPMVGAVVVRNSDVVGTGYHEYAGGPHAEVNALNDAGELARGATIYVTLEPCNHTGRTPPCTQKILDSGIARVVVAMQDPNPDVTGGGIGVLREKGIQVDVGIEETHAARLNEFFVKYVQTKRPFVILKTAATLDGRIATRTGDSKWVTGPAARNFVHTVRHAADAIMVGIGTVKQDDPSLTTRLEGQKSKDPLRIVLDTHLSISENARLLNIGSDADTLLVTGADVPREKKHRLEKQGVTILESQLKDGFIDLDVLMYRLGTMKITSLLVEGGGRVAASALACRIVDKILFFYAPKILGGDDGVPVCQGPGPDQMSDCTQVHNILVHRFDDDILIEGYIRK
jgi:diaminohydroxyphosphoribosylaminopyrimidine deaminase / 5-amino-6-(5-phosphoribosylamino)uracil reductase